MAKVRLYYDISELEEEFQNDNNNSSDSVIDIVSFKIYECKSKDGNYSYIDEADYIPLKDYVETDNATSFDYWFKLSWVNSNSEESELSEPSLGEDLSDLLDRVIEDMGDLDRDKPAISDESYIAKIRSAVARVTEDKNISKISEEKEELIVALTRIPLCYELAYKNAKYYPITLPDDVALDRGRRVDHYLGIAKQLEAYVDNIKKDMSSYDEDIDGDRKVQVVNLTRKTYFKDSSRIGRNRY